MADDYDLRAVAPTAAAVLGAPAPAGTEVGAAVEVVAALKPAERLALVVIDGFGSAVWAHVRDAVPTLNRLGEAHHREIRSVLPSMTYICISTMMTGGSPLSHGVADREGMARAAGSYEVDTVFDRVRADGRETLMAVHKRDVEGIAIGRFADHTVLAGERNDVEIYARVPELVAAHLPAFAFVHLLDIDEAGHAHGPYAPEVKQAAAEMDRRLRGLLGCFAEHGYALMALADHGLHPVPGGKPDAGGHLGMHDGSVEEDLRVPLFWATAEELEQVVCG